MTKDILNGCSNKMANAILVFPTTTICSSLDSLKKGCGKKVVSL